MERIASFTRPDGTPISEPWPRFFVDNAGVERVEISWPTNPHSKPVFAVTDEHRQHWPSQYEAFQASQAEVDRDE